MKKRFVLSLLAAMTLSGSVWAAAAEEPAALQETQQAQEDQDLPSLGQEQEGDYAVKVTNATGKEITSVTIQIDSEDPGENLLGEEDTWEDAQERILYVTPKALEDSAEGQEAKPPVYDIILVFDDETTATLHTFPFGDTESVEVKLEDEIAYITFESKSLAEEYSSLEHEKNLADQEAAAAAASSQTTSSVSYNTDYDYSYDDSNDYNDNYSYDYDYDYDYGYENYDNYSYDDNTSGGDDNGCIDDGVILN